MAEISKIEWTDATWNPITGCTMVSAGCTNCYAMGLAGSRLRHHPSRAGLTRETGGRSVWTGDVRFNEGWLDQPLRWLAPRRIFVCAHGDLFHEAVPDEWIDRVFAVMALCPQHTFQVLTKRPERMREYVLGLNCDGARRFVVATAAERIANNFPIWDGNGYRFWDGYAGKSWDQKVTAVLTGPQWPLPNVWIGTSIEDQATADARIPHLLATPAAVRFTSAEPLLGPVDLLVTDSRGHDISSLRGIACDPMDPDGSDEYYRTGKVDWVVVGGESGPGARPMHPDWARSLRDQCAAAGVPFFFKQWGEWSPCTLEADDDGKPLAAYPMVGCCDPQWHDGHQQARFWMSDGQIGFWTYVEAFPSIGVRRVGKARAGRLLDGRTWDEMPGEKND